MPTHTTKSLPAPAPFKPLRGVRILSLALNIPGPAALMRLKMFGIGIPAVLGNPLYAHRHRGLRALFTWGLPVIPVIGTYDGLVSTLRCYTPDELRAMFVDAGAHDWSLDTTTFRFPYGGRGVVFTAVPPPG